MRLRLFLARLALFICLLSITAFAASPLFAASFILEGGGGWYNIKTQTLLSQRFYHIDRQRFDFSCGSAALASLLTYHYDRPSQEKDVIKAMYDAGDKQKIQREGFSLLDMKNYLQTIGLRSNGYRESLDKLEQVGIPAIVLINRNGYLHFVIIQGVTKQHVLIGDPALGKKIVDRAAFEASWNNHILFVIEDETRKARRSFNTTTAWHVKRPRDFLMPMPTTDLAAISVLTAYAPNSFQ